MNLLKYLLLVGLLFCSVHYSIGQDYKRIEALADMLLEETKLPGLSMAIAKKGEVIYSKGFGFANVKERKEMAPTTQLRTASIAKVLTATALGRLATLGKLDFDDIVKKHVPYINEQYENLTIRQLAGHTSGMNHRPSGGGYKNKQYTNIKETVLLIKDPLLFEPGSEYRYSTNAYNLLGAVIEGASGMRYQDYMHDSIFAPLGMQQTFPENIQVPDSKNADLYYLKKGKLKREPLSNGSYKLPGASFRSTPSDLVKLMNAYTNGMISSEVTNEMFKSNVLLSGEETNVGIAWRTSMDIFGNQVIEHAGSWKGTRTVLVYYPKEELVISLMINATCRLLIEETAHIFMQLFRLSNEALTPYQKNEVVEVTLNEKEGVRRFQGNFILKGETGTFKTDSDGFLSSNKVFAISNEDEYALVCDYGLLYMNETNKVEFEGKLFAYLNRNKKNPKEKEPMASLKALK